MRLHRFGRLKERRSFPPNKGYRTRCDKQDGGRSGCGHPPVSDKPASGACGRGHNWRGWQSFERSRRHRRHLAVLRCIRQIAVTLTFKGRATSIHAKRKSVAATRYVLNAALAVAAIIKG